MGSITNQVKLIQIVNDISNDCNKLIDTQNMLSGMVIYNNIVDNYDSRIYNMNNREEAIKYLLKNNLYHCNFCVNSDTPRLSRNIECDFISIQSININPEFKAKHEANMDDIKSKGKKIKLVGFNTKYTIELYTLGARFNGVFYRETVEDFPSKCLSNIVIPMIILPYTELFVRVLDSMGNEIDAEYTYKCTVMNNNSHKTFLNQIDCSFVFSDTMCRYGVISSFIEMDEESCSKMELKKKEDIEKQEELEKQRELEKQQTIEEKEEEKDIAELKKLTNKSSNLKNSIRKFFHKS